MARTPSKSTQTRVRQLERDISRAVNRLLGEFYAETELSPHAVDVELEHEPDPAGGPGRYVVSSSRALLTED